MAECRYTTHQRPASPHPTAFPLPHRAYAKVWCTSFFPLAPSNQVSHPLYMEKEDCPTSPSRPRDQTTLLLSRESFNSSHWQILALLRFIKPSITSQEKWNETFPVNDTDKSDYWGAIYKIPYKAMRDMKYQAFHFRIVHRFVPCNRFLRNIRINTEDTCSYCPLPDTIEYFFFECPLVKTLWRGIVDWFDRVADVNLNVSLHIFLFGISEQTPQAKMINFILIFVKFYIYRQKLFHQGDLSLIHLLHELKIRLQVEKYITTIENKQHQFQRWNRVYAALH